MLLYIVGDWFSSTSSRLTKWNNPDCYSDYNNSNLEPKAIGGGTYARAFDNCISFGPQMPDAKDMCHQTDEFISIENLMFCTKVYAEAILKL